MIGGRGKAGLIAVNKSFNEVKAHSGGRAIFFCLSVLPIVEPLVCASCLVFGPPFKPSLLIRLEAWISERMCKDTTVAGIYWTINSLPHRAVCTT